MRSTTIPAAVAASTPSPVKSPLEAPLQVFANSANNVLMIPTPNLGSFIRSKREGKKLSLRAFAEIVEIAPAFQSDIEHGRRYPSPDVLERTAKALGVDVDEMKAADTRVQRELKEWLERNPGVQTLLKDFQKSGRSGEELVAAWRKVVARKRS